MTIVSRQLTGVDIQIFNRCTSSFQWPKSISTTTYDYYICMKELPSINPGLKIHFATSESFPVSPQSDIMTSQVVIIISVFLSKRYIVHATCRLTVRVNMKPAALAHEIIRKASGLDRHQFTPTPNPNSSSQLLHHFREVFQGIPGKHALLRSYSPSSESPDGE